MMMLAQYSGHRSAMLATNACSNPIRHNHSIPSDVSSSYRGSPLTCSSHTVL
jgi:hypothetical protein